MADTAGGKLGFNPYQQTATLNAQKLADTGQNQGAITGVRKPLKPVETTPEAPKKADAAPNGTTLYQYVGLCDALNEYEQNLCTDGPDQKGPTYDVPNVYKVVFVPSDMGSAKVAKQGPTDDSLTPMVANRTPKSTLVSDSNTVDTTSKNVTCEAGTPIVQFIEQLVRNSTYVTDQQKWIKDKNGNVVPNTNAMTGNTTWFKIGMQIKPILPYDKKRRDYAREYTYTITPYGINQVNDQYFENPQYKGIHKVYNYWFTGENTQVLNYEQDFNQLYFQSVDPTVPIEPDNADPSSATLPSRIADPRAGQTSQGGSNGTNDPAARLADFLYSSSDQASVKLKILGDPAWLQQGEVLSTNPNTINFNGFNPDGTINFDSQQINFAVVFNTPADYDLNTGLMNVNAYNKAIQGSNPYVQQQSAVTYYATSVTSYFHQGRFEQELSGSTNNIGGKQGAGNLNKPQPSADAVRYAQATTLNGTRDSSIPPSKQFDPNAWNDGTAATKSTVDPYADPVFQSQLASQPSPQQKDGQVMAANGDATGKG